MGCATVSLQLQAVVLPPLTQLKRRVTQSNSTTTHDAFVRSNKPPNRLIFECDMTDCCCASRSSLRSGSDVFDMNHRRLQRPNRELRRGLPEGCRATQTHMQGKHRGLKRCSKLQTREGSLADSVSQSEPPVQIPRFQDFARSSFLALRLPEPYRKPAADERLTSVDN
jgi:hypothetical protein